MRTACKPASTQRAKRRRLAAVGVEVDRAVRALLSSAFDRPRNRDRAQQGLAFAPLSERNDAVFDPLQMMDRDVGQFGGRDFLGNSRLRRWDARLVVLFRDAADAARVALRRHWQCGFAPLEKDVLRGKACVVSRAECDLRQHAVLRLRAKPPLDQRFELAALEAARLPIVALVGLHRRHVDPVVDRTSERIAEERQRGGTAPRRIRGNEQTRKTGRQRNGERRTPGDRADRRQRRAFGKKEPLRAGWLGN